MNRNPYESPLTATRNFSFSKGPLPARQPSIGKRLLFWFLGFVLLFLSNVLVEWLILPHFGLDNTPKNDVYFQAWWILVGVWLVFGMAIISALQRTTARVLVDDLGRGATQAGAGLSKSGGYN